MGVDIKPVLVTLVFSQGILFAGNKLAESIVINTKLYCQLYDAVTKDLPRDCLFNQSQPTKRQTEGNRKPEQRSGIKSKNAGYLKWNRFPFLHDESDSDD